MRNERTIIVLLAALVIVLSVRECCAQTTLSEERLFRRCYAHITQLRPKLSDPLLAAVKEGSKTAVQACQETFNRALLTASGGTRIADPNDPVAKSIVHTFNELHRSWSRDKGIFLANVDERNIVGSEPWFDDNPMGPYITRALLNPAYNVDSVTQGSDFVQPVREIMTPPQVYRGIPSSVTDRETDWRLGTAHPFAPRGDILGVRAVSIAPNFFFPATRITNVYAVPDFGNLIVAPAATQNISNINFANITAVRGPLAETDQFLIQIQGQITLPTSTNYTFSLDSDDGSSLILDGQRIINFGQSSSGAIALSSGLHSVAVEYRQYTGGARLILRWQSPNFSLQVVPVSAFTGLVARYWTQYQPAPLNLAGSEGGGFLGSHNYFVTTFMQADENFVADGGLKTNRSWGRAVFSDALCREVPVLREEDVGDFVKPQSTLPFRQFAACNTCHASLDGGVSGVIRGLQWNMLSSFDQDSPLPDLYGIYDVKKLIPTLSESTTWTDVPSVDYPRRAPFGRLFFRNMYGTIVNQEVRSIEELGTAIRAQDDYYACFAKRYYRYFTGIEVDLNDPGRPFAPALNSAEAHHRAKVLELGTHLKATKSLPQLILDIIGSDEYRSSDYGVTSQEGGAQS